MTEWVEFHYPSFLHTNDVSGKIMQRIDVAIYDIMELDEALFLQNPYGMGLSTSNGKAAHSCTLSVTHVLRNTCAEYPLIFIDYPTMLLKQKKSQPHNLTKWDIKESIGLYAINEDKLHGLPATRIMELLVANKKNIPIRLTFQRITNSTVAPTSGIVIANTNIWSVKPFCTEDMHTTTWFSQMHELRELVQSSEATSQFWKDAQSKSSYIIEVPRLSDTDADADIITYKERFIHQKYGIMEIIPVYENQRTKSKRLFMPEGDSSHTV